MKKSLIALAVLAASGASFAQVSITGNLTYGYQSATVGDVTTSATGVSLGQAALTAAGYGQLGDTAGMGAETAGCCLPPRKIWVVVIPLPLP